MNWLHCQYWLQVSQYGWQRGESDWSPSDRTPGHDSSSGKSTRKETVTSGTNIRKEAVTSGTNIRKETVIHRRCGQQPARRCCGVSIAKNTNTSNLINNTAITTCTISLSVLYQSAPKSSFESFLLSVYRPFLYIKTATFLSSYLWRVQFSWQKLRIWSSI